MSRNSGGSWDVLCDRLGFVSLFIHPDTGVLYAVVGENDGLRVDQEGNVMRGVIQKIVMSTDGANWKDITPNRGNLDGVASIVKDANNRGRICLSLMTGRGSTIVIRWLDDAYLQCETTEKDFEQLFFRK